MPCDTKGSVCLHTFKFQLFILKIDYVHLAKILGKIILFHLGMFLDSTGIGRAPTAFRRLRLRKNAQF